MFSISPCCNPCKPACTERLDAREVSDSQGKSLAITSLVLGILAVLVTFLVNINSRSGIAGKNCSFASACKVLAYITGYNEKKVTEKIAEKLEKSVDIFKCIVYNDTV